jgi:hypothetical protein
MPKPAPFKPDHRMPRKVCALRLDRQKFDVEHTHEELVALVIRNTDLALRAFRRAVYAIVDPRYRKRGGENVRPTKHQLKKLLEQTTDYHLAGLPAVLPKTKSRPRKKNRSRY